MFNQTVSFGQYGSVYNQLPPQYKSGTAIYLKDSLIFAFKAKNYLDIWDPESIPHIRSDSTGDAGRLKLIETLKFASDTDFVVLKEVQYNNFTLFPNSIILKELFTSRKIMLFRKGNYTKIAYRVRRKRRNPNGPILVVYEKSTKKILFETGY